MNSFFLKVLIGCVLFLLSNVLIFANTSYSISPMRSEIVLNPSVFSTGEVIVFNGGNEIKNFEVYFEECVKSQDTVNCGSQVSGGSAENSLSFWISIPEGKKYTISPNSSKTIQYNITIPSSAKGGSYFGIIKAREINENEDIVNKKVELGSVLLLTINTAIQSNLDVGKANISMSSFSKGQNLRSLMIDYFNPFPQGASLEEDKKFNIKFSIPVKNSGNVYLKPIGKIEIFDNNKPLRGIGEKFVTTSDFVILGKEIVDFIPLNSEGRNILPNEQTEFVGEWKGFVYNKMDPAQKIIIDYQSPSEYFYSLDEKTKIWYPFYKTIPREKVKNLSAKISIGDNGSIARSKDYIQEMSFTIKYQGIEVVPNFAIVFWFNHILSIF